MAIINIICSVNPLFIAEITSIIKSIIIGIVYLLFLKGSLGIKNLIRSISVFLRSKIPFLYALLGISFGLMFWYTSSTYLPGFPIGFIYAVYLQGKLEESRLRTKEQEILLASYIAFIFGSMFSLVILEIMSKA